MKIARPKTERWYNYLEGDAYKPKKCCYKKGFWKRYGRKKFFRNLAKIFKYG